MPGRQLEGKELLLVISHFFILVFLLSMKVFYFSAYPVSSIVDEILFLIISAS